MSKFVLTAQLQLQAPTNTSQVVSQMQQQLSKGVNVKVNVQQGKQATKTVQDLSKATKTAGDRAAAMGRSFAVSFKRFAAFSLATRTVGLFTRSLSDAVGEALDFERQLIKVAQVTGKSVSQLSDLTREVRSLATGLGVSSQKLLEVSRILAQAGMSADETRVALSALAKSALAATFDDIVQTTEGAVAIFNQFGQGAAALEGQLGSINAVAGQFAVEAADLIAVIRRTGGVFKAAGGDLNELIALFTSVRSTTRESAESIATGLRTIFTRIQRPSTIRFLEDLGIKLTDAEGKFVGGYKAIQLLSEALKNIPAGDLQFIRIAEQLGGFRQIGKIIPLLSQFGVSQEALNVALAGTNSLTQDAETAQGSLLVRITALKEQFLEFIAKVTKGPTFQILTNTALSLASSILKVADAVQVLAPLLTALTMIKIGGALSGFAGGFMGGGKGPRAFNSGGLVPGSGNRDTVPAMLTPGEYVIRKSSVGKIGVNNLSAMNNGQRFADGGIARQSKVGTVSADVFSTAKIKLGDVLSADQLYKKNPDNAWTGPQTGKGKTTIEKEVNSAAAMSKNPELFKQAAQEELARLRGGLPTTSTASGLGENVSKNMAKAIDVGAQEGVSAAASNFAQAQFKKKVEFGGDKKKQFSDAFNAGAKSAIFEMVVGALGGAPLANIKNTTTPFDFTDGLSDQLTKGKTSIYPDQAGIMYIDAKSSGKSKGAPDITMDKDGNLSGMKKDQIGPKEISKKVSNQFVMDHAAEILDFAKGKAGTGAQGQQAQTAALGGFIKKYATGGAVSDTVPAMLTPGEYVINKDAAQSIGKGNLDRMNKQGVTGFAKGGAVGGKIPGVQYLNMGGAGMAMAGAAMLPQLIEQTFGEFTGAMSGLVDGITTGLIQMFAFSKALQFNKDLFNKLAASTTIAASKEDLEAQASVEAAMAGTKLEKELLANAQAAKQQANVSKNLTKEERRKVAEITRSISTEAHRIAEMQKAGATQKQIDAENQKLKASLNQVRASIQKNLSGPDMQKVGGVMKKLTASTDNVSVRYRRQAQFLEAFTQSTAKGKTVQDAMSAGLKRLGNDVGKTSSKTTEFSVKMDHAKSKLMELGTKTQHAVAGLMKLNAKFQTAAMIVGGLAMALNIWGEMVKQEAEANMESALKSNDFEGARAEVDSVVMGNQMAEAGNKAMMMGMIGAAVLGPFGALLGTAAGMLIGMLGDTDEERKKQREKVSKAELTFLKDKQKAELDAIQAAGKVTADALRDVGENFRKSRTLITDIVDEGEREKATKELDASIVGASNSMGGLAKDQAELDRIIQELSKDNAHLSSKIKDAAQASFNLAQAAKVAAKAQFDAATVTNVFSRASLGVDNFVKSLESGSSRLGPAIAELEEAMKNFAMGDQAGNISKLQSAMLSELKKAGVQTGAVVEAVHRQADLARDAVAAQQKLPAALQNLNVEAGMTDEAVKGELERSLLAETGVDRDSDIGRLLLGAIAKLDEKALSMIKSGSFDFTKFLDEANKGMSGLAQGFINGAKDVEKFNATITKLTKKRIEMEGKLLTAQRAAIDAHLEAAEIMAEFGGSAVSGEMRKQATLDKMNLATSRLGLGELTSGSASEIAAMSQAVNAQFASLETRSRTPGAFAGSGIDADRRKELQAAQKDLASVTKQLIQLNREELEILKKKNALEKESLEAAISGDLEKFLKDSMSVGATAALATGNDQMAMSLFGAEGIAGAFENIQSMQEAGVQSLFGQQIGGQGGLLEQSAGAALGMRGIDDPRMAAMLAGTTAEEQRLKDQNMALAGSLSTIADNQTTMAEMQVQTAQININNAQLQFSQDLAGGNAQLLARGGTVYAKDGIELFKPKGTDTVPAMLTPGEVIVNNRGANAGNNRGLLRRMNNGEAIGSGGQAGAGIDPNVVKQLITGLSTFNTSLAQNIEKLQNTKFQIKLDTTNVNVNLNGGGFLAGLKKELKGELMADVGEKIKTLRFDESGNASFSDSSL